MYIKTFELFGLFKKKPKVKPFNPFISDTEILKIDDLFLEISEKYNLEEDPTGKILNYMDISLPSRRGRSRVQYFIEKHDKDWGTLLVFTIASSSGLYKIGENDGLGRYWIRDIKTDLDDFKKRLNRCGYECGDSDIIYRPWLKCINFTINKNLKNSNRERN